MISPPIHKCNSTESHHCLLCKLRMYACEFLTEAKLTIATHFRSCVGAAMDAADIFVTLIHQSLCMSFEFPAKARIVSIKSLLNVINYLQDQLPISDVAFITLVATLSSLPLDLPSRLPSPRKVLASFAINVYFVN